MPEVGIKEGGKMRKRVTFSHGVDHEKIMTPIKGISEAYLYLLKMV